MLVSFDALAQQFAGYTDVKGKIRREVQGGRLVQVARGLYETDVHADGKYLAGAIYGPSYLSFDYALSVYSLIPEVVYGTYTSATFRKGKTKRYENAFGTFLYRDVPAAVYPLSVEIKVEGGIFLSDRLARKSAVRQAVFAFARVFGEGAQRAVIRRPAHRRSRLLCTAKGGYLAARAALPRHQSEIACKVHKSKLNLWSAAFFTDITKNLLVEYTRRAFS